MAKSYGGRSSSRSSAGSRGYGSKGSSLGRAGGVSAARLSQKSGASNAFGGYAKVKHSNGTFSMRSTGKQSQR